MPSIVWSFYNFLAYHLMGVFLKISSSLFFLFSTGLIIAIKLLFDILVFSPLVDLKWLLLSYFLYNIREQLQDRIKYIEFGETLVWRWEERKRLCKDEHLLREVLGHCVEYGAHKGAGRKLTSSLWLQHQHQFCIKQYESWLS